MSYSLPPPAHQHTWADLLALVGAIRRVAFLPSWQMGCDEQMRRIRDLFHDFDHPDED